MVDTLRVQIAQRGVLVLPKALRESYGIKPGDDFTLLDLGGIFVLTPQKSQVDAIAERISGAMKERGESLETILQALREERERYAVSQD